MIPVLLVILLTRRCFFTGRSSSKSVKLREVELEMRIHGDKMRMLEEKRNKLMSSHL